MSFVKVYSCVKNSSQESQSSFHAYHLRYPSSPSRNCTGSGAVPSSLQVYWFTCSRRAAGYILNTPSSCEAPNGCSPMGTRESLPVYLHITVLTGVATHLTVTITSLALPTTISLGFGNGERLSSAVTTSNIPRAAEKEEREQHQV